MGLVKEFFDNLENDPGVKPMRTPCVVPAPPRVWWKEEHTVTRKSGAQEAGGTYQTEHALLLRRKRLHSSSLKTDVDT